MTADTGGFRPAQSGLSVNETLGVGACRDVPGQQPLLEAARNNAIKSNGLLSRGPSSHSDAA